MTKGYDDYNLDELLNNTNHSGAAMTFGPVISVDKIQEQISQLHEMMTRPVVETNEALPDGYGLFVKINGRDTYYFNRKTMMELKALRGEVLKAAIDKIKFVSMDLEKFKGQQDGFVHAMFPTSTVKPNGQV